MDKKKCRRSEPMILGQRLEPQSAELSVRAWADLLAESKSPAAKKGLQLSAQTEDRTNQYPNPKP